MTLVRKHFLTLLFLVTAGFSFAQVPEDERYVPETDQLVLAKLKDWQGLKFGLLMHWGPYSQWGVVESWSICPEEYGWCERKKGSNPNDYNTYLKEYEGLQRTFNPVKFDPNQWALAAKNAGMRYVVFTTKHHDGFTMFNSKHTNYKVTDPACPYSVNPRSNIAAEIFNAFRNQGMWTGAYFSKPDWHNENYWNPAWPPRDRNVNYAIEEHPEKWAAFTNYTHNQIMELMTDYGKMDILWLDGGWVAKKDTADIREYTEGLLHESSQYYLKRKVINQDIQMDALVKKVREKQPGILVVDRAVHGKNQNYLTPENRVPEKTLPYPWESCIISGGGWSYTPDAKYMSGREGIHLLCDIVAKGGNLLLNIAPGPDGTWQPGAYQLLEEYGAWMKINASAIYETQPMAPYKEGNVCLTQEKSGAVNFIYLTPKDQSELPSTIAVKAAQPTSGAKVTILGSKEKITWKATGGGFEVTIPESLRNQVAPHALVIRVSKVK